MKDKEIQDGRPGSGKIPKGGEKAKTGRENRPHDKYGETMIVLMPKDPWRLFAYWELSESTRGKLKEKYGEAGLAGSAVVLRVHEVTGARYSDILPGPEADNWYLETAEPGKSYHAELGVLLPNGKFISLARSNTVNMPRYGLSPVFEEQWGKLEGELQWRAIMPGFERPGLGSLEARNRMSEKWLRFIMHKMPSSGKTARP